MSTLKVAIHGASGSAGRELCRLLLSHPDVDSILPASRSKDPLERVHRNLLGSGLAFCDSDTLIERAEQLDLVFFATAAGEAMSTAPLFLDRGVRVIDLSGDFRFSDPAQYERVYRQPHQSPALLDRAVYGITELERERISGCELVANPGCYVITAILALWPLLAAHPAPIVRVHAINGTSGAGSNPGREVMHAAAAGDMLPYNLDAHRHGPELENQLERLSGRPVQVELSTAHGPFARGIELLASVPAPAGAPRGRDELTALYERHYGPGGEGEYFVRVNTNPRRAAANEKEYDLYPSMAAVVGTNFCHIGLDWDDAHALIKIVAVTDNLGKGAAGSAIQNMNVMFGLNEHEGLAHYGL